MTAGYLHKIIKGITDSIRDLSLKVSLSEIERVALVIHEAMAGESREFHSLGHIFDVAGSGDAIETLAAYFHDVVYYQVDRCIPSGVNAMIGELVLPVGDGFRLAPAERFTALPVAVCLRLFGFKGGDLVPREGQNELMSALAAARCLGTILTPLQLLQVLACIEATIPFRNGAGKEDSTNLLRNRIIDVAKEFALGLTEVGANEAIARTVRMGNRDLGSFAQDDSAAFLVDTWKLFTESNPGQRLHGLFSIKEYRRALQKVETFFSTVVHPEHIFHVYDNVPAAKDLATMKAHAKKNVQNAIVYLRLKLYSVSLIEALAELSGGDAPMSLFMGDNGDNHSLSVRMEDMLMKSVVQAGPERKTVLNSPVFNLLAHGRSSDSGFSLDNAPLAAFIFLQLGESQVLAQFGTVQSFWDGKLEPMQFLSLQDPATVSIVARLSAEVASTRRPQLASLAETFKLAKRPTIKIA